MKSGFKAKVWQYPAPDKRTVYFRGHVAEYHYTDSGCAIENHACPEVRQNKWQAKEDSEKLLKKLKKAACQKSNQMSSLEKQLS